jgi:hypothetical protein
MKSYVYRIGFPSGHYYIGVKKGTPESTTKYVGSPKRNKWMWDQFPVVCKEVLWVTETFEHALEIEKSVLLGLDYSNDPLNLNACHWVRALCLNGENNPAYGKNYANGKVWVTDGNTERFVLEEETPKGWRRGRISKPTISDEDKKRRSERMSGEKNPAKRPEVRAKLRASSNQKGKNNSRFGIVLDKQTKDKISEGNKNSKDFTCPHCGKTMKAGNYARWHGDNCKMKRD